ncbi:MAG: MFS transporter [Cytophagales bacterium]|nr:MFS transporter [Bernardetiaceae bacterium]MDW8211775.1 MFS transporter [Cytophagales bacterium]
MHKVPRLTVFLLATVNFTHIMDFMIIMPLGDILMRYFRIQPQQFSMIVSAYTLAAGIAGFLGAFIIDYFDRKKFLLLLYSGFLVGTLACGLAASYLQMLLARALTGAFGGVIGSLVMAIVSDLYPWEQRGRAMGLLSASFSVASVFGVPFGLFMADQLSWPAPFLFLSALGAALMAVLWNVLPPMKAHLNTRKAHFSPLEVIQKIFSDRNQVLGLALSFSLILSQMIMIPFITPYMIRNVGLSQSQIPLIYFFGGIATIFSAQVVGRLTDKIGVRKVFTTGVLLSYIPIITITNLPPVPVHVALIATTAFFIFINSRMVPAHTMISGVASRENRGSFMSFNSSAMQIASAVAAFLSGLIVHEGSNGGLLEGFYLVGIASLTISFAGLLIAPRLKFVG